MRHGFTQLAANVFNHFAVARASRRFAALQIAVNRTVIEAEFAGIALCKQMTHAIFDGRVGGNGFQTAKIPAMAALTQRVDLNVADLTHVAVTAQKNLPVRQ